jgi:hypothetical protein
VCQTMPFLAGPVVGCLATESWAVFSFSPMHGIDFQFQK